MEVSYVLRGLTWQYLTGYSYSYQRGDDTTGPSGASGHHHDYVHRFIHFPAALYCPYVLHDGSGCGQDIATP